MKYKLFDRIIKIIVIFIISLILLLVLVSNLYEIKNNQLVPYILQEIEIQEYYGTHAILTIKDSNNNISKYKFEGLSWDSYVWNWEIGDKIYLSEISRFGDIFIRIPDVEISKSDDILQGTIIDCKNYKYKVATRGGYYFEDFYYYTVDENNNIVHLSSIYKYDIGENISYYLYSDKNMKFRGIKR